MTTPRSIQENSSGQCQPVEQFRVVGDDHHLRVAVLDAFKDLFKPRLDFPQGNEVVRLIEKDARAWSKGEVENRIQATKKALPIRKFVKKLRISLIACARFVGGKSQQQETVAQAGILQVHALKARDCLAQILKEFLVVAFQTQVSVPRGEVA